MKLIEIYDVFAAADEHERDMEAKDAADLKAQHDFLRKIMKVPGSNIRDAQSFWCGGGSVSHQYVKALEDAGYTNDSDDVAWRNNQKFFEKYDISEEEYKRFVDSTL